MAVSRPERSVPRAVLIRAVLAGFPLGVTLLTSATVILAAARGLVTAATGVIATAGVAFLVGLWAGAPAPDWEEPPIRERGYALGAALAAAGAVATVLSFYRPLGSSPVTRMGALFVLLALPAYAVALLLPALLEWGEQAFESVAEPGADPDPWGVLGPLSGGFVAGIVVGVALTGLFLLPRYHPAAILLVVSIVPVLGNRVRAHAGNVVEETTLFEASTPFAELRVAERVFPGERQPERRLYLDGEEESGEQVRSGAPVLAYVAAAERWLAETAPRGASYLFLGGGAYTLPRRVAERDSTATVTAVELDPEVTRIAYRFFGLRPELGVRIVHGDATAFVARAASTWDAVYIDVYGGHESLPYSLVTREAFQRLAALLSPGGTLAMNVIGTTHGPESPRFWSLVRTMSEVFPSVALYSNHGLEFPDRQNFLLAGSLSPEHLLPGRAGLFAALPREVWPSWARTVVFREISAPTTAPSAQTEPPRPPAIESGEARGERPA
jgi:hypothetical protein